MNVDSQLVLDLLSHEVVLNYRLKGLLLVSYEVILSYRLKELLLQCESLLSRSWHIQLLYCYIEANHVTDYLVNFADSANTCCHTLNLLCWNREGIYFLVYWDVMYQKILKFK